MPKSWPRWRVATELGVSERLTKKMYLSIFSIPQDLEHHLKKSLNDTVWVPMDNVLRKLTPLELSTQTGRSHTISKKLSEEISKLLMKWKPK